MAGLLLRESSLLGVGVCGRSDDEARLAGGAFSGFYPKASRLKQRRLQGVHCQRVKRGAVARRSDHPPDVASVRLLQTAEGLKTSGSE